MIFETVNDIWLLLCNPLSFSRRKEGNTCMATPGSPVIIRRGEELEMENLDKRNKETNDLGENKEDENTESTSKYCCIDL